MKNSIFKLFENGGAYKFGFASFNLTLEDFTIPGNVIQLGYPPLRIDLLTEIDGVAFEECYANRKEVIIENLKVNFIGYNDLIKQERIRPSERYR